MAKKKETPATPAEMTPEQRQLCYPETTETRSLKVNITLDERNGYASELAKTVEDVHQLEEQKKATVSEFKSKIDSVMARQSLVSQIVRNGYEYRPVKCEWAFECAGVDSNGDRIFHPEKKTLFRQDTGESVEVQTMTETDRQPLLGKVLDVPAEDATAEGEISEEGED